jgi:FkbM family methyltransferase
MIKLPFPNKTSKLYLLDIGARGGMQWPWTQIEEEDLVTILVEPDPAEAKSLQDSFQNSKRKVSVLPIALWSDKSQLELNLTKSPGASSVFPPNIEFLEQFPDLERFQIDKKFQFQADTIDSLVGSGDIKRIDFAKIDVQGAELEILKGGEAHFSSNLVGLEVEIEFAHLYKDQPLFSDIDSFVRNKLGLELWDINKSYWKYEKGRLSSGPAKGRLIFGDALYFRPITGIADWLSKMPKELAKEKIINLLACVLSYGYIDYAEALIKDTTVLSYLDTETIFEVNKLIKKTSSGIRISRTGISSIYWLFITIANIFKPSYNGWASRSDRHLGSYKFGPFWF